MVGFDFLILILAFVCWLTATNKHKVHSQIIFFQMLLLLLTDVVFIDLGMYKIISTDWFFIVKGVILFSAILMMCVTNGQVWITMILFINMIYMYGLWIERSFTTFAQLFHSLFMPAMVTIMLLELIYLFRVSSAYDSCRRVFINVVGRFVDLNLRHVIGTYDPNNGKA